MVKAMIAQSRTVTSESKQARHLRSVSSVVVEVVSAQEQPAGVCPHFHAAIELIGKRWTGAIVFALTEGPLRFGEVAKAVPGVSDGLLRQRVREREDGAWFEGEVEPAQPVRVTSSLTKGGAELRPAI